MLLLGEEAPGPVRGLEERIDHFHLTEKALVLRIAFHALLLLLFALLLLMFMLRLMLMLMLPQTTAFKTTRKH